MDESMKSEHQLRVEQFMNHKACGQAVPDRPTVPDAKTRLLRAQLILEEALETVEALGFCVVVNEGDIEAETYLDGESIKGEKITFAPNVIGKWPEFHVVTDSDINLDEIADGCADLSVVSIGTLSACGIPDKPILECVDQNNLEKFGPGASVSKDGKLVKPPNHKPPQIAAILDELLHRS